MGGSELREAQRREREERKRKASEGAVSGGTSESEDAHKKPRGTVPPVVIIRPPPPPPKAPIHPPAPTVVRKDKEKDAPPHPDEPWVPVLRNARGELLSRNASVRESRKTAMTLLKALALPRDMKSAPASVADSYAEMCAQIVRAGQTALSLGDKVTRLGVDKSEVEKKLSAELVAKAELQKKAEGLATDGREMEKQLAEARRLQGIAEDKAAKAESRVTKLEGDLHRATEQHDEMLAAADINGFQRGAAETLKKFAGEALENEEKAFRTGYLLSRSDCWPAAFLAAYDIVSVPADSALRSNIPPAPEVEVPEMPLEGEGEAEDNGAEDTSVTNPPEGGLSAETVLQ